MQQLNIQSTPQITSVTLDSPLQNRTTKPKVIHRDQQQNNIQTSWLHKSSSQAWDNAFRSWFTVSSILSSTGLPWQQNKQVHSTGPSIDTMLSNYNQDQWSLALWWLFHNTAWDRWRYRNGIQQGQQDLTWRRTCNWWIGIHLLPYSKS